MSEFRDSGLECQAVMAQERPRGASPHLRPGMAPEARGGSWEEPPTPEARASGQRSKPRSGGCAGAGGPRGAIPC